MTQDSVVLDASVILEWVSPQDSSRRKKAIQIYRLLKRGEIFAFAPTFLLVEVVNVLFWKKKQKISEIKEFVERIKNSGINFVGDFLPESVDEILDVMVRYDVTSYDAQYVDLALKKGLKLATFDETLVLIKEILFKY